MYQLDEPKYFYLLAIIPILFLLYLFVFWWKKRKQKQFADSDLIEKLSPERSTFKLFLKFTIASIGLLLLIISLVNPKMGTKLETVKRQGVDIVFALDVSKSMLAQDIAPNRLEKAKQIITKVIDKLGSDRVGIIIYAGNAYPLLPLTTDHASAEMFLQNANTDMVSSQGTAISEAIDRGINFFDPNVTTNRFLFIVSDGEDHQEDSYDMLEKAAEQGIKVYSVGIGTTEGGPIPLKDINGNIVYKKDSKGEVVITKMNPQTLTEIAEKGGGKYINGNNTGTAVKYIDDLLINSAKNKFEAKEFSDFKDQFQWFIGFGLLFLIIDVLLLEKKTKWVQQLNLFNQKNATKDKN